MKKKPLIGISCSQNLTDNSLHLWQAYVRAIKDANGLPLILPVLDDLSVIEAYVDLLDGLLLSGGVDIDSVNYREEPLHDYKRLWPITPERDFFELTLTRALMDADKPILGICRGLQLINVAANGSLYQDLSFQDISTVRLCHFQEAPWWYPTHNVELVSSTRLYEILNQQLIRVNSLHHQSIKDVAPGLVISAKAVDGTIEGIESVQNKFVLGVQWHPELLLEKNDIWLNLFERFVDASCSL